MLHFAPLLCIAYKYEHVNSCIFVGICQYARKRENLPTKFCQILIYFIYILLDLIYVLINSGRNFWDFIIFFVKGKNCPHMNKTKGTYYPKCTLCTIRTICPICLFSLIYQSNTRIYRSFRFNRLF